MRVEYRQYSKATSPVTDAFIRVGMFFPKWYERDLFWKLDGDGIKTFKWWLVTNTCGRNDIEFAREVPSSELEYLKDYKHIGLPDKVMIKLKKKNWIK
jgi:hypothetical protein